MQNKLKTELNLPTSETLPTGDEYTSGYAQGQFYDDTNQTAEADGSVQNVTGTENYGDGSQDGSNTGYDQNYDEQAAY